MKLVINGRYGGFSISKACAERMAELGCEHAAAELADSTTKGKWYGYGYCEGFDGGYDRSNPYLVQAVEELGAKANGHAAALHVVDIPDDVQWELDEYDGIETIHEVHRSWP